MSLIKPLFKSAAFILFGTLLTACANTGVSGSVHYSSHYGPGWHDPMYYPHWHSSPDIVVVAPPKKDRPSNRPPGGKPKPSRPRPSRR